MADWYVSSATYASVAAFVASHAYSVGDLLKPTAPALGSQYVFRCTTAGTSATEPTWSGATSDGQTITSGGATFTNVSGRSAYGWSAAAGNLWSISTSNVNRPVAGDRVFLSSDHSETITTSNPSIVFNNGTNAFALIQLISVNRAGSVPPVAADVQSGAAIAGTSGSLTLDPCCNQFWQGITFTESGTSANIYLAGGSPRINYFKNCSFVLGAIAGRISTAGSPSKAVFDNTTIQFGAAGQFIGATTVFFDLIWINTPSAIQGGTLPTTLFEAGTANANIGALFTCRGVDFSAVTGTLVTTTSSGGAARALFDSCRINSGVTRYSTPGTGVLAGDEVELINCYDGTNVINERHSPAGDLTTERSTTLVGGATDSIGGFSLKMVSSSRADPYTMPLDGFWFDVENSVVGTSRTATVEIISSASLNNNNVRLVVEYMGASGTTTTSFIDSLPSVLTATAALPTSSNTWNSPPSTPVKQLLQVTFTPQRVGRVRGRVSLGKVSTTVWVNPQIALA